MGTTSIKGVSENTKMKKIVAFGDSFIYGSEIEGNCDGSMGWPGIAARDLCIDFECRAEPGCGNERILQQILHFLSTYNKDVLVVVNWTWSARWDLLLDNKDNWVTVGPTCTVDKLWPSLGNAGSNLLQVYENLVAVKSYQSVFHSLQNIIIAMQYLQIHDVPSVHTFMDYAILAPNLHGSLLEFYQQTKLTDWPNIACQKDFDCLPTHILQEVCGRYNELQNPPYFALLQDSVKKSMSDFDGLNFLDWSRSNGFEITPDPGMHPLADAHRAAAYFWRDKYASIIA